MLESILGSENTNITKLSMCIYRADIYSRLLKKKVKRTLSPPVNIMKKTAFQKLSE